MTEYQRFDGKEYVTLRKYYNLECKYKALEKENKLLKEGVEAGTKIIERWEEKCEKLEDENEKLKDEFMLHLAEAFLLPPTSPYMDQYKKWNFCKWYNEVKDQMRKEIMAGQ